MSTNRTHQSKRTSDYDFTPTLRWLDGELVVLPVWMANVLDRVLPDTPVTADRPNLFGEAS